MSQRVTGPPIGLYVADPSVREAADLLAEELRKRGHDVVDAPDARTGTTVAVLPPGEGGVTTEELAAGGVSDNLIPVVFGDRASSLMPDRSQLVRPLEAVAEVADRIGQLIRLGGTDLIAVNGLAAAARRWDERGRASTELLDATSTAKAPPLLALAHRAEHPDAARITEFVHQSGACQGRLRRRRRIIVSVASVLLAAASVAALVFRANADAAAAIARMQAEIATSNRLASLAGQMLDSKPDPDLTWLLAQQAVETHASAYAVGVARLVEDAIPSHRSIALGKLPSALVTSDRGRLAILYRDGSFDVRDAEGQVIRASPADAALGAVALSNDGLRLAVAGHDRIVVNRDGEHGFSAAQDTLMTDTGDVVDLGWQGDRLLVATRTSLQVWSPDGLVEAPFQPSGLGTLRGMDVTPDGLRIALWGDGGTWIGDGDGGNGVRVPVSDTRKAVLTTDGSVAYMLLINGGLRTVQLQAGRAPVLSGVMSAGLGLMRIGDTVGLEKSVGEVCPMTPPAWDAARCVTAHAGPVAGAGSLGSQRGYASVGFDDHLRLWATLDEGVYPSDWANAHNQVQSGVTLSPQPSRLECDPGGPCWALTGPTGALVAVDRDLQGLRDVLLGESGTASFALAEGGGYAVWHNRGGPVVSRLALDSSPSVSWRGDRSATGWNALNALSPDGRTYVTATPERVSVWREGTYETLPAARVEPVAVLFGLTGDPHIYFADGSAFSTGSEEPTVPGEPVRALGASAADPDRRLWWVNGDNELKVATATTTASVVVGLPAGFEAQRLRPAADGRHVALFAPAAALVVRVSDGQIVYRTANRPGQATVEDLAFVGGDDVLTIDKSGALRRAFLIDDATTLDGFLAAGPRAFTDEERALFQVPADR